MFIWYQFGQATDHNIFAIPTTLSFKTFFLALTVVVVVEKHRTGMRLLYFFPFPKLFQFPWGCCASGGRVCSNCDATQEFL